MAVLGFLGSLGFWVECQKIKKTSGTDISLSNRIVLMGTFPENGEILPKKIPNSPKFEVA